MDTSVILNWIFGGGLLAALTALLTLGPTVRKARSEAERARADAEAVRIDNTEHATRILMENIVEPLKKEIKSLRRDVGKFRKAIERIPACPMADECPVTRELRAAEAADARRGGEDGERADGGQG